jgi:hypothetical protein
MAYFSREYSTTYELLSFDLILRARANFEIVELYIGRFFHILITKPQHEESKVNDVREERVYFMSNRNTTKVYILKGHSKVFFPEFSVLFIG